MYSFHSTDKLFHDTNTLSIYIYINLETSRKG